MAKGKNPKLKRAYTEVEYTPEQVEELKRCAADPVYFIEKYVWIKGRSGGPERFKLDWFQKEIILNYFFRTRNIVLASRQVGKTEVASAFILWYAIFHSNKTILATSYRSENSKEIIQKIVFAYEELPDFLRPGIDENAWNKTSITFENKSRVIADTTSENSGRGLAIDLLYVDEFAHIKHHIQEAFFTSVLPTLSSRQDGRMIITSTPNGDIDEFSKIWRGCNGGRGENNGKIGDNGFTPYFVKWDAVPGRGEKYKREMMAQFGETRWLQEFECEFISDDHTLIPPLILKAIDAKAAGTKPIYEIGEVQFYRPIFKHFTYIIGVDLSEGGGNDFSVIEIFEFPSMDQVGEYRINSTSPAELYGTLKNVLRYLELYGGDVFFSVENNGLGQSIVALYEVDEKAPEKAYFVSETGKNKQGINTNSKSKIKTCILLKEMLSKGTMTVVSPMLIRELKTYIRLAGSYAAKIGSNDDTVAACLIVLRIMEEMAGFDDNAYHKLYTAGLEDIVAPAQEGKEKWDEYDENNPDHAPLPFTFI